MSSHFHPLRSRRTGEACTFKHATLRCIFGGLNTDLCWSPPPHRNGSLRSLRAPRHGSEDSVEASTSTQLELLRSQLAEAVAGATGTDRSDVNGLGGKRPRPADAFQLLCLEPELKGISWSFIVWVTKVTGRTGSPVGSGWNCTDAWSQRPEQTTESIGFSRLA